MWKLRALLPLVLITAVLPPSQQIFTNSKSDSREIVYPTQAKSERGLALCEPNSVCNVLYRHFWYRMRIERMCRCSHRLECPMDWSNKQDNHTMGLSNRSQLKFCQDIAELPQCSEQSQAITVRTQTVTLPSTSQEIPPAVTQTSVLASCNCLPNHYWELHQHSHNEFENGTINTSITYKCVKLRKCIETEFCGNMRADNYFTYYQCSCLRGQMCLQKNQMTSNVSELLFMGPAFEAVCTAD